MENKSLRLSMIIILCLSMVVGLCFMSANGREEREKDSVSTNAKADEDEDIPPTGWRWDDKTSAWYYISPITYHAQTGWFIENNNTYFLDEEGKMQTGWIWDTSSNAWYLLDNNGAMCKGWAYNGNSWYYLSLSDGKMQTGWITDGGNRYFLCPDGRMQVGWYFDNNMSGWCYFDGSGAMCKGWINDNGLWYYLSPSNGKMKTGWLDEGACRYYLESSGKMCTGWCTLDEASTYLFTDSGAMYTGWILIDNEWYYFVADRNAPAFGKMKIGWLKDGESSFYFGTDGKMFTGLVNINSSKYYFDENGFLQTGSFVLNSTSYQTDVTGKIISETPLTPTPTPTPSPTPETSAMRGIDVSQWQGSIDWTAVKNSGIDYVMIRSNYGWTGQDKTFHQNIQGAKAAGLKVGVYLYSYATTPDEARLEYDNLMSTISGYSLDCPVAYDLEDSCQTGLTVQQMTDVATTFCELVRNAGYKPMIYASAYWMRDRLDYNAIAPYYLWVAQYNTVCEYPYRNPADVWQYSSTGSVSGINGNVDLDYFYTYY